MYRFCPRMAPSRKLHFDICCLASEVYATSLRNGLLQTVISLRVIFKMSQGLLFPYLIFPNISYCSHWKMEVFRCLLLQGTHVLSCNGGAFSRQDSEWTTSSSVFSFLLFSTGNILLHLRVSTSLYQSSSFLRTGSTSLFTSVYPVPCTAPCTGDLPCLPFNICE